MTIKRKRQFYVPRIDGWRWERKTDTYIKLELDKARAAYVDTENALAVLDTSMDELARIVYKEYRLGTLRLRETVEKTAAEIRDERRRVTRVQDELELVIGRLKSELKQRRVDYDRKLPA